MAENDTENSSAIREAAEKLVGYLPKFLDAVNYYVIDGYYRSCYDKDLKELRGRMDFLKSALAAPARNCDVGTAKEQAERFKAFCLPQVLKCSENSSCPAKHPCNEIGIQYCQLKWAQLPYEAEGGNKR